MQFDDERTYTGHLLSKVEADEKYVNTTGDRMQGDLDMCDHRITNLVSTPTGDRDAVCKAYCDAVISKVTRIIPFGTRIALRNKRAATVTFLDIVAAPERDIGRTRIKFDALFISKVDLVQVTYGVSEHAGGPDTLRITVEFTLKPGVPADRILVSGLVFIFNEPVEDNRAIVDLH